MPHPRRWIVWPLLVVLTLLLVGSCGLFAFTRCHPANEVQVVLKNVPADTERVNMAAMTEQGPVEMEWRPTLSFDLRDQYMPHYQMPRVIAESAADGYHFRVYWWRAEQYGVVLKNQKGEWRVAWFPASEVPLEGRTVFGGGKATFDLSKAEIVPLDADTVKVLGLQDVKPMK